MRPTTIKLPGTTSVHVTTALFSLSRNTQEPSCPRCPVRDFSFFRHIRIGIADRAYGNQLDAASNVHGNTDDLSLVKIRRVWAYLQEGQQEY